MKLNVYQYDDPDVLASEADPLRDGATRWIAAASEGEADALAHDFGWDNCGGLIYTPDDVDPADASYHTDKDYRKFGCDVIAGDRLAHLHETGFDLSKPNSEGAYSVRCSACSALAINGIASHELRCPNQKGECDECGCTVDRGYRMCDSCANPAPYEEEEDETDDRW